MTAKQSLAKVRRARERRAFYDALWREAIVEAASSGVTLRAIAEAAGVTHVRIHQLVHARRGTQ